MVTVYSSPTRISEFCSSTDGRQSIGAGGRVPMRASRQNPASNNLFRAAASWQRVRLLAISYSPKANVPGYHTRLIREVGAVGNKSLQLLLSRSLRSVCSDS